MTTSSEPEVAATTRQEVTRQEASKQEIVGVVPAAARALQGLADAPPITPRRRKPTKGGKWRRRAALMLILGAAGAAVGIYWEPLRHKMEEYTKDKGGGGLGNIQTYTVKRGELRITMVEEGKLRAVKNNEIRMGAQGKITWLAEAGAKVKKGDKIATLDTTNYETNLRSFQTQLETAVNSKELAEKQLPIAEAKGVAAVETAKTTLLNAQMALKQYTTLDVRTSLSDLETKTNDARTKLGDQQKKRGDLQQQLDDMLNEGDEKDKLINDLATAKASEDSLKRTLTTAESQRTLFRKYTYPQQLRTKERAVKNAELDLLSAETNAKNEYLSKQGEISRATASIAQYKTYITQYENNIQKATATAPADGLVFYGSPDNDRYGISQDQIKVGADWYYSGPIMTIPDLSSFQVAVPVAEVYRGRVTVGVPATVIIDAVPGLVLQGTLASVSSVSRPKVQYDSNSPSVYDATLSLAVADERMIAGMTVRVEIVTAELPDVLYAPVEAVYNEEGKTAAFVWIEPTEGQPGHVEKRPVLTGQANDHFVELKQGVTQGEKLLLSRPTSFVTPRNYQEQVDAMFPAVKVINATTTQAARGGMAGASTGPAAQRGAAASTGPRGAASQPAAR